MNAYLSRDYISIFPGVVPFAGRRDLGVLTMRTLCSFDCRHLADRGSDKYV